MLPSTLIQGVASDGTLTQDPRLYSARVRQAECDSAVAVYAVLCAEMQGRTQLECDAMTSFQRIVGLRVAERHGRWAVFLEDGARPHEPLCPRCGWSGTDDSNTAGIPLQQKQQQSVAGSSRLAFQRHEPCVTPLCDEAELRERQPHRCRYADDATALLERRYGFQQECGTLLQRIKRASQGIQDSVTR